MATRGGPTWEQRAGVVAHLALIGRQREIQDTQRLHESYIWALGGHLKGAPEMGVERYQGCLATLSLDYPTWITCLRPKRWSQWMRWEVNRMPEGLLGKERGRRHIAERAWEGRQKKARERMEAQTQDPI